MKYTNCINILVSAACLFLNGTLAAQFPPVQWIKQFGGSASEIPYTIKCTTDGGTIVAGFTDSKNGDIRHHSGRDYWDLWVVKLNKCGSILWEQSFGGTGYETAKDIVQTADGGYLVLGETNSADGDVVAGYGSTRDIWVLKLTPSGQLQWQKRYGGTGLDVGNTIYALSDGNYLIAASTSSNDGDITGNHGTAGYTDGLLLKIDPAGNKLWTRCFGGSRNDELMNIQVVNNKIYVTGYANSTDGDIPVNQKNYDVWLLATDLSGNKLFSKIYGGTQNDVAYSIAAGTNNTLTMAGYTTSNDGNVSGAKGSQDFWILNVDLNGNLKWQQTAGGTDAEFANTIINDSDGGYLIGGVSYSEDIDVDDPKGQGDYWILKLNYIGHIQWKKNIGGKKNDNLHAMAFQPALKEYYFAGDTESENGDFIKGKGDADFGIIKCKLPDTVWTDTIVCPGVAFTQITDTLKDACGYDSAISKYRIITTNCESAHLINADTLVVPNAFTPNGDGKNDYFGAAGKSQLTFSMQLFNRYGEVIFQSNSISNRWNGIYKNKPQPTGGYVYVISYTTLKNQPLIKKGTFLLIRN